MSLVLLSLACSEATNGLGSDGDEGATGSDTGDTASGSGVETGDASAEGDPSSGDGDGDPSTGDGDGDPSTGDGDGDPSTGDGDGDPTTGDGDGDPTTGDGDGDPTTGDGDGDPPVPMPYGACPNNQNNECAPDWECLDQLIENWQVCTNGCDAVDDCPAMEGFSIGCVPINANIFNKGCFITCAGNNQCPDGMNCESENLGDKICVFDV